MLMKMERKIYLIRKLGKKLAYTYIYISLFYSYCECGENVTTTCGIRCPVDHQYNEDLCECEFVGSSPEQRCQTLGNGTNVCIDCLHIGVCTELPDGSFDITDTAACMNPDEV